VGVPARRPVAVRGPGAGAGRGGLRLGLGQQHRNRGIASLLADHHHYTRQSSLRVSATELAVMGATLADGGVNPITGERVVDAGVCHFTMRLEDGG
jgi:hypothetical protein